MSWGTSLTLAVMQAAPSAGRGMTVMMIYLVAFALIMWLIIIRPQRKMQDKHRAMIAALKKGDEVMTDGGIIGQVVHLAEDRITMKTGENTRLVVSRSKIARVFTAGTEQS